MPFPWLQTVYEGIPVFIEGLQTTLSLFFIAAMAGTLMGGFIALAKSRYIPGLYWPAWAFVELFRNIPLLVILFFFYYALQFTGYFAGLFALIAWASAFTAEVMRAGIESLEPDQIKASRLLGLSRFQIICFLVLPQAFMRILPIMANQYMNLAKNTSIVYFVGVLDVTYAFELLSAKHFLFFQFFFISLSIYVSVSLIIIHLFKMLEAMTQAKFQPKVKAVMVDEAMMPATGGP